jgi:hypothetical protein
MKCALAKTERGTKREEVYINYMRYSLADKSACGS